MLLSYSMGGQDYLRLAGQDEAVYAEVSEYADAEVESEDSALDRFGYTERFQQPKQSKLNLLDVDDKTRQEFKKDDKKYLELATQFVRRFLEANPDYEQTEKYYAAVGVATAAHLIRTYDVDLDELMSRADEGLVALKDIVDRSDRRLLEPGGSITKEQFTEFNKLLKRYKIKAEPLEIQRLYCAGGIKQADFEHDLGILQQVVEDETPYSETHGFSECLLSYLYPVGSKVQIDVAYPQERGGNAKNIVKMKNGGTFEAEVCGYLDTETQVSRPGTALVEVPYKDGLEYGGKTVLIDGGYICKKRKQAGQYPRVKLKSYPPNIKKCAKPASFTGPKDEYELMADSIQENLNLEVDANDLRKLYIGSSGNASEPEHKSSFQQDIVTLQAISQAAPNKKTDVYKTTDGLSIELLSFLYPAGSIAIAHGAKSMDSKTLDPSEMGFLAYPVDYKPIKRSGRGGAIPNIVVAHLEPQKGDSDFDWGGRQHVVGPKGIIIVGKTGKNREYQVFPTDISKVTLAAKSKKSKATKKKAAKATTSRNGRQRPTKKQSSRNTAIKLAAKSKSSADKKTRASATKPTAARRKKSSKKR